MGFSSANKAGKPGKSGGKAGKPSSSKGASKERGGFASKRKAQEEEEEEELDEEEEEETDEDEEDEEDRPKKKGSARPGAKGSARSSSKTPARGQEKARASAGASRTKRKGKKSSYAGVSAKQDRDPIFMSGDFHFEFRTSEVTDQSGSDYFRAKFEVVSQEEQDEDSKHAEGKVCTYLQGISGSQERMGRPEIKRMVMAFSGYDDEEEFEEKIPSWELLCEAVEGDDDHGAFDEFGENPLEGRRAFCGVYYRSEEDSSDGKPYRGWRWKVDEDQDALVEE